MLQFIHPTPDRAERIADACLHLPRRLFGGRTITIVGRYPDLSTSTPIVTYRGVHRIALAILTFPIWLACLAIGLAAQRFSRTYRFNAFLTEHNDTFLTKVLPTFVPSNPPPPERKLFKPEPFVMATTKPTLTTDPDGFWRIYKDIHSQTTPEEFETICTENPSFKITDYHYDYGDPISMFDLILCKTNTVLLAYILQKYPIMRTFALNNRSICRIAWMANIEVIKTLVSHGMPINLYFPINSTRLTVLEVCLICNSRNLAIELLQMGADADVNDCPFLKKRMQKAINTLQAPMRHMHLALRKVLPHELATKVLSFVPSPRNLVTQRPA